jgi:membrane-associated phospholipid phosphatase
VVPAVGAFVFFDLPVAKVTDYVAQMAALRDGALRVIDLGDVQGLVVFPSFHAALAVICAAVAQGRWIVPVWGFNLLIVAASPAIGGHYFVDILAGILLACITVGLVHERPRGTVPV